MGSEGPAVDVRNLTFVYKKPGTSLPEQQALAPVLDDISISLPPSSRLLLVGANGSGKSTLLTVLAGKRMPPAGSHVEVLGEPVFFKTPEGVTYLGTEWASNPVVRADIVVADFLNSIGGYKHKERRDHLLNILDVDLDWHMHQVSDGERRRVQIVAGLMAPFRVLLLDEVTVDLDVLVRTRLLEFLMQESANGATVLYATHIFDGLDAFPTHVCHMRAGKLLPEEAGGSIRWPIKIPNDDPSTKIEGVPQKAVERIAARGTARSALLEVALAWLEEDWQVRKEREKEGHVKRRGAREETRDSEAFYKQYDYSH